MDWLTTFSIVAFVSGVTLSVVVLMAVGTVRRIINDSALRQTSHMKRMLDMIATLNAQQEEQQNQIQALTEANRRLGEQVAALGERVGDEQGLPRTAGAARMLH